MLFIYCNICFWNCPGLRPRTLNKAIYIQRRLAWSLCKDDTQNRREQTTFLTTFTSKHSHVMLFSSTWYVLKLMFITSWTSNGIFISYYTCTNTLFYQTNSSQMRFITSIHIHLMNTAEESDLVIFGLIWS